MTQEQREIRLKQLEKVNKELESEIDPEKIARLVAIGRFLLSIIEEKI